MASEVADTAGAPKPGGSLRAALIAIAGLSVLLIGGSLFVDGAGSIARTLGLSERLVGLTSGAKSALGRALGAPAARELLSFTTVWPRREGKAISASRLLAWPLLGFVEGGIPCNSSKKC